MAEKIPLRVEVDESDEPTGLAEFQSGEVVPVAYGGTGASTAAAARAALEAENAPGEPTGFVDRTASTISLNDTTRTFSITPASSSYDLLFSGARVTIDAEKTVVWGDTEGLHYFYFDDTGTLTVTTTFTTDLLYTHCFVALIYWDATNSASLFLGEERHGASMDGATHVYLHNLHGSQWRSGFEISSITADGTGDLDAHAQIALADGVVCDEDLCHDSSTKSQTLSPTAQIPVFYRSGASSWRKKTADGFPLIQSGSAGYTGGSGLPAWNENNGGSWQLTEVSSSDFFMVHYFATNEINTPIVGILGQATYNTAHEAETSASNEIYVLYLNDLPTAEYTIIHSVLFEAKTSYGNTVKARVVSVGDDTHLDWRQTKSIPSSVPTHNHDGVYAEADHTHEDLGGGATTAITASEDLAAGDFVNVWNDAGTAKVRKADGSVDEVYADGYVAAATTSGNSATVYLDGINDQLSGLTPGTRMFLSDTTPGGLTDTPPTTSGSVVQYVGKALSATELAFEPGEAILKA